MKIKIKLKVEEGVTPPSYSTEGSAGFDIRANEDVMISPFETIAIPTGLYIELERGFELQIRPRSGLSLNTGIRVVNSPGTIDPDYRGEIKVILQNTSTILFQIKKGDRIAQGVICPYFTADWDITETLSETRRGAGGFGHTGNS